LGEAEAEEESELDKDVAAGGELMGDDAEAAEAEPDAAKLGLGIIETTCADA